MRNLTRPLIRRTSTLLLLLIFSSFIASAQKAITGKITDARTKEPVANASVLIKGKSTGGTTTDENGAFSISASPGDRLVITHVPRLGVVPGPYSMMRAHPDTVDRTRLRGYAVLSTAGESVRPQ